MPWKFDCLIVGAGFSGLTIAERLATLAGRTSLVVERRGHIGGNAYDHYDDHGVLIHTYGPHYFRTNSPKIRDYLSRFTAWHPVDYRIKAFTEGRYWSFPVNLQTFEQLLGRPATTEEFEAWLERDRVPCPDPKTSEDIALASAGRTFYQKFFLGYTLKQWRRHPRELDASVCGRIPVRTNRDDRYLREDFQALPAAGYTRLFERMLASCSNNVRVLLHADFREVLPHVHFTHLIYTGPIDEFFDCRFGRLPYRSLRFEPESFTPEQLREREPIAGKPGFYQPAMQVNYPGPEPFTRIVEIKHATGQLCANTTIVREYPQDYGPGAEPYYPIPAPDSQALYQRYRELAETLENQPPAPALDAACSLAPLLRNAGCQRVSFVGRLATYRYYNMDQVTGMALHEADNILRTHQWLPA